MDVARAFSLDADRTCSLFFFTTFPLFFCFLSRRLVCNSHPEDFSNAAYKAGEHAAVSSTPKRSFNRGDPGSADPTHLHSTDASAAISTMAGIVEDRIGDASGDAADLQSMATVAKAVALAVATRAQADEDGGVDDDGVAGVDRPPGIADGASASASADAAGAGMLRDFAKRTGVEPLVMTAAIGGPVPLPPPAVPAPSTCRDTEDESEYEAQPTEYGSAVVTATGAATPFAHVHGEHDVISLPAKLVLPDTVLQVSALRGALHLSARGDFLFSCRGLLS